VDFLCNGIHGISATAPAAHEKAEIVDFSEKES